MQGSDRRSARPICPVMPEILAQMDRETIADNEFNKGSIMHTLTVLSRYPTSAPRIFKLLVLLAASALGQDAVTVRVNATQSLRPFPPVSGFFGYDEANYTYTDLGRKLIGELAALSRSPVYVRTHFLLNTGNGDSALKWGSTNAYTEDASGRPIYDWTIIDRIFKTYLEAGAKRFVEIGFMPKA